MNETDPPKRSLGERLNTWVQTIGILIAAAWGVYTFVHKEITAPRAAPVNISLDLQLKKLGANEPNKELVAVELKASATNPSTREIHLLPNLWTAYGINVVAAKPNDSDFRKLLVSSLADPGNVLTTERHASPSRATMVAAGHLFGDTILKPNEKAGRTIVFYIPRNTYDLLDVISYMPCAADTKTIDLEWKLQDNADTLEPTLYRIEKNGKRTEIARDPVPEKKFELQTAQATAEISLWAGPESSR